MSKAKNVRKPKSVKVKKEGLLAKAIALVEKTDTIQVVAKAK